MDYKSIVISFRIANPIELRAGHFLRPLRVKNSTSYKDFTIISSSEISTLA